MLGMKVYAFLLSSLLAVPSFLYAQDKIRDSVVKIHAVRGDPDLVKPWTKRSPKSVSGSGVVIDGNLVLTNAHVVQYASQIYVQPNQSADKLVARVALFAPSIDLALLRLEDESFFDKRGALPLAEELPAVKDTVNVYGYPTGGSELSVTEGIISRIEFTHYHHFMTGLRIQVDAALNPGNSGGPAVSDGKLIGLVFNHIPSAQNIGYIIPVEEIRLFLEDISDGSYDGKPQMLDDLQTVENDALRKRLGLPQGVTGMMVVVCSPMFPHRITKGYDDPNASVLKEVNGTPVKNLRHLVETLRNTEETQIVFKFARKGVFGSETLVFDRNDIMATTEEILNDNGIRHQYSDDLRVLWEKPRAN